MRNASSAPVSVSEAKSLFSGLDHLPVIVLAVSGGPDSTALMLLAARWRQALKNKPKLIAVTVDHGLRKEARREAADVAKLARKLGIAHQTLRWRGAKPKTGLQQAARTARYNLLGEAARRSGAAHVLTAHTMDDQAETVMIRMSRGSGLSGLGAMGRVALLPGDRAIRVVRPLLGVPKARLIATLRAKKISFANDASNRDPQFARVRMRDLMPALAREGLDARRLWVLARRLKRADLALEAATDRAEEEIVAERAAGAITFDNKRFAGLPAEIALRLLGRAIAKVGDEGPVELAKLEALKSALDEAQKASNGRLRRSLAGAVMTFGGGSLVVEKAPPRRGRPLTTGGRGEARSGKTR